MSLASSCDFLSGSSTLDMTVLVPTGGFEDVSQIGFQSAPHTAHTHDADAAFERGADAINNDEVLFDRLKTMWQDHLERGLELRHRTGAMLNARYGSPAVRQKHGEATFIKLSKLIGVAESEISRMRWFAHLFISLSDLKTKHSTTTTWTQVKTLLAQLRATTDVKAQGNRKKVGAKRPVGRVIEVAKAFQKRVQKLGKLSQDTDDWKALRKAVDVMLKAAGASLGLQISVTDTAQPESSPQ